MSRATFLCGLAAVLLLLPAPLAAGTDCKMTFTLSGWSAGYKTAKGKGKITCDNGQSAKVKIDTKGGGFSFGKSTIEGEGAFSEVKDIDELFGSYASAEAHAGAVQSTAARVMTKGEVSLAISGKGKGWDVGFSFGRFSIEERKKESEEEAD